eukprot:TRINITY_DN54494_c0_g1_i1.p1 TRINITY_DN54494_c0_g1~~TRINITY_DN54494_c0_g1_i1.p1  ORF type:complete len:446 (-),score=50.75 TRINITY_DN54494_c0_g1_i1:203-1540(-)
MSRWCGTARSQAVLMGCIFLLVFAAYDSIQVFATRLYPGDLGSNMLLAVYSLFTFSELVAPAAVNKLGPRMAMSLGILGYASVPTAGFVFFETGRSPLLVLLSGCVCGIGASFLWTGQGRLILEHSTAENRGVVFAIFWTMYRLASVTGGILSFTYFSVVPGSGSAALYVCLICLILVGAMGTLWLENSVETVQVDQHSQVTLDDSLQEVAASEISTTWFDEIRETLRTLVSSQMLLLTPICWSSGAVEPFILSGFTARWFEKRTTGMEMVLFFSLSVIGSIFTGRLLDSYSKRGLQRRGAFLQLVLVASIHVCGFVGVAIVEYSHDKDRQYKLGDAKLIMPSFAFALFGLSDAMMNSLLFWLIGVLYASGPTRAHAVGGFKLLNSAAHIVGYLILPVHRVSAQTQLIYNAGVFCLGIPSAAVLVASKVGLPDKRRLTATTMDPS